MLQNEHAWKFAKRLVYEAIEVAEEDGTYFDRREVLTMLEKLCIDAGASYSSMYQDMKRGVKTEIDVINGAIVEQAKLYGVPVPYNTLIVDLIHAIDGSYEMFRVCILNFLSQISGKILRKNPEMHTPYL